MTYPDPRPQGLRDGLLAPIHGLRYIAAHPNTWPVVVAPALLFATLLCGSVATAVMQGPSLLRVWAPSTVELPAVLRGVVVFGADFLLAAWMAVVSWYLTAALSGPFHDRLSAMVEVDLANADPDPPWTAASLWGEVMTSIGHSLLALTAWASASCALLVLQLVPVAGSVVGLVGTTLVSAWMLAWQSSDYPLSRRRLSFREKVGRLRDRLGATTGLGLCTLAMVAVPIVNLLAPPAAVVGATLLSLRSNDPARPLRP